MKPLARTVLLVLLLAPIVGSTQEAPRGAASPSSLHRLDPQTPAGMQKLFTRTDEALPIVGAHRGGPRQGFPENCLATFEETLRYTFASMEVDPRYTKDGAIVLHHDATLERTTTGKGRVTDFTLVELKQLRLKDTEGKETAFQIPTLDEALEWARGKTILVLDQKDVPVAARVRKIEEHKAEGFALLIVNTFKDAQTCHALNTNIMMEVMIPNLSKAREFDTLGIPWRNVITFVGHVPPEDAALYGFLHRKGVCCMVGTSRNLDRKFLTKETPELKSLEPDYRAFLKRGADLIETDVPADLGKLLYGSSPVPVSKQGIFRAP